MALRIVPRLHRATHQVALYLDRERESVPVTQAEAHVLALLSESGGACGVGDVHRSFGHKRSTLTGILDRLEQRGLIERRIHPQDRRSFMLHLSAEGAAQAQGARKLLERLERRVRGRVDEAQLAGFLAVLDAIDAAAGEE
jgi:MarR family transcriptional regulator, temperature-dependent positive regulator of motility